MYYIISTKWTHKSDAFFTFWRPNDKGYCWSQELAGIYENTDNLKFQIEYNNLHSTLAIDCDKINNFFVEVNFEGHILKVLPNILKVRTVLGINKTNLNKLYPSNCPRVIELNSILIKN